MITSAFGKEGEESLGISSGAIGIEESSMVERIDGSGVAYL
jgi:hypothetical protein